MFIRTAIAASAVALISACASSPMMKPFDQAGLPAAVQVPAGNKVFWENQPGRRLAAAAACRCR